ncbi:MAG: TonB-dependent receptor [Bacteroidetes bacterium]|nr:TonB-dependent receptor [Bacteroidota bacterium]
MKILFLSLWSILPALVFPQEVKRDTVILLREVEVNAPREDHFAIGNKILKVDSSVIREFSTATLADLLACRSHISVRSYGSGGLSSTSIRGAGSYHTAVLWNGFNLQCPTDGGLNMTLIPVSFIDNISLQYGGSGALFGSGAVGGVIHLNNSPGFGKGFNTTVEGSYGSYDSHREAVNISIGRAKWSNSVKYYHYAADNDFPFINSAQFGKPQDTLTNAFHEQQGLMFENYVRTGTLHQLSTRFWYQKNLKYIPPSMVQDRNEAYQEDEFYRGMTEWNRKGHILKLYARSAWFDYRISYHDPILQINSDIRAITLINEAETEYKTGKTHDLNFGINNTTDKGITDNYTIAQYRTRTAVFGSFKIHNPKNTWNSVLSIREEWNGKEPVKPTPSIGFTGKIVKPVTLNGNVSRNYRVPTFNDLYWKVCGNPDLKPEYGWSEELGLAVNEHPGAFSITGHTTAFNSTITDWIIWLPAGQIWTPQNIKKVWSRGIENDLNIKYRNKSLMICLSGNYSYTKSTDRETDEGADATTGMQLIYVPVHKGNCNITAEYKGIYLSYTHNFTGSRFTTADNTRLLEPYDTGQLSIFKSIKINEISVRIQFDINNTWNEIYQVMAWYAMPQRNYRLSIQFSFNHKK